MSNKEYTSLRQRLRVEAADSKLLFVGFALLIMVIGPIITGVLINVNEQELLASVDRAQRQVQALRPLAQVGSQAAPRQRQTLQAAFGTALREQEHAKETINALHDIQDCVIAVFGLLGLVAAFYSRRALHDTRATLRDLDTQSVDLAAAYEATREGEQRVRQLAESDARRARALESLFETAGHLSVSATPRETREYLTQHVARVLQASRVALWSYDPDDNFLSPLLPSWGFEAAWPASARVAVEPGEWAHELLFCNATILSNTMEGEGGGALCEQLRAWNVKSVLAVPLIAHGRPVGVLCACDKQESVAGSGKDTPENKFTDEDERVLRTFAAQAAFVLHSAQQYANARARSEELAALARITRVLVNSLELECIVPAFLQEVRALVPYGHARLALLPSVRAEASWSQEYPDYDEEETPLLRRLRGKPVQTVQSSAQTTNPGSAARPTAPTGQPASVSDANVVLNEEVTREQLLTVQLWTVNARSQEDSLPSRLPAQTRALDVTDRLRQTLEGGQARHIQSDDTAKRRLRGTILIPLIVQRQLLGALEFEEAEWNAGKTGEPTAGNSERFAENHFVLAQQAAGQFAAAIQNAQSFAEATRRAEQLQWGMQETHHRIKNNLQTMMAILDLYLMEVEDAGGKTLAPLSSLAQKEAVAQEGLAHALREVRTIAAVHGLLSEDIHNSHVNARYMLDSLIPLLLTASVTAGKRVQTDIEAEDIVLPSKLVSALALTANELIINGVRHGGLGREELRLGVELKRVSGHVMLRVTDDGRGFAPGFDPQKHAKIGLSLTRTLIERDFKGKLTFSSRGDGKGAVVTATIPY